MNNLLTTLDKMQEVLSSLSNVIEEEQLQLSAGRINSNLLQRITEDKGALLATLSYLDEMRRSTERQLGTQAPYAGHSDMTRRWQSIGQMTRRLNNANTHSGLLLNQQIRFTEEALAVLKPHQTQAFYGPDGLGKGQTTLSRKV
ncbi:MULTISPECIES: flagella synthesis protein FlgN [Pantoea]|jgi:flagella synthesis protein FlgN|uniref:Flagellar export chaperone FlgN n=1 Tax=Pantoea piersonii TaxID=2364647 RepID=A0AAJ5QHP3_9GAMM|nr:MULTISPECIES: flagellar export chaperone FlgN [Pantoea]MDU6432734.1 flagellar export chaperone FlgN [Pantoea sp.]MBZ6385399.1 flagellar export chaperone FlgN [Pantoea piersonii]MBZ6399806.1 flagellar export chaperone FlgN [Pantoea piersonii]MBZ6409241.1 flagellar export chaperone FlgN [Pantoea piersonii]MBZ6427186.1 flagellar export chaperone FlgN [Pantoea piersonii]